MSGRGPDQKAPPRIKASAAEWRAIRGEWADVRCVACPKPAEQLHHIVARSRGGDDIAKNLVPICPGCHMEFEDHGKRHDEVAGEIRDFVCRSPERWAYVVGKLGQQLFDRTYPHPRKFTPCPDLECVLAAGHRGRHRRLSAVEYQPKGSGAW